MSNLDLRKPQNIQLLQQLSSLSLHGIQGVVEHIQPTAPMPKLRHLDLTFFFYAMTGDEIHRKNIREKLKECDDVFPWIMDNAATTFPSIEELSLAIENIKTPVKTNFDVNQAAAYMDTRVRKLLVDAPHMKHFKISQGRSQRASLLSRFPEGAFGPCFSAEFNLKRGLSQSTKWQRDVEFNSIPVPGELPVQQVIYEYTRKEE